MGESVTGRERVPVSFASHRTIMADALAILDVADCALQDNENMTHVWRSVVLARDLMRIALESVGVDGV